MSPVLIIHLHGRFRVETMDGDSVAPKSAKAQGVLALLATAPRMERGRRWLQDKLWSDRAPKQGAASLRQALTDIRKALGDHADILLCDRVSVQIGQGMAEIAEPDAGAEFLEGLDIPDPEFDHWLASMRAQLNLSAHVDAEAPSGGAVVNHIASERRDTFDRRSRRRAILFLGTPDSTDWTAWAENLFIDCVARSVRENFSVDVVTEPMNSPLSGKLVVRVQTRKLPNGRLGLRVALEDAVSHRQLWSGYRAVAGNGGSPTEDPNLVQLVNLLIETIGAEVDRNGFDGNDVTAGPNQMCRQAIRLMFSMSKSGADQADALLKRAFDLDPKGIFLAWRAQLRTIQRAERHSTDAKGLLESARSYVARAIELEPYNSMVLATAANTRLFVDQDVDSSLELARRGVALNSANPMGWWALSAGKLYAGETDVSLRMADLARRIAVFSPNGFWWDLQRAAGALVNNDLQAARRLFESIHRDNPEFHPPMRYLTALYADAGEDELAAAMAEKLSRTEVDFTVERLLNDREYPASLMWRAEKLDKDKLRGLT